MSGKLYKRKDGYWYYKYKFINELGYSKYKMIACKTKDDETALKVKLIYDKTYGDLTNPLMNPRFSFKKIGEDYITQRNKQVKRGTLSPNTISSDSNSITQFSKYLKNKYGGDEYELHRIDYKEIQKYIDHRLDEVSPTTCSNNVKHLSSFFSWCVKKDLVKKNPCLDNLKLTKPKPRKRTNIPSRQDWKVLWDYVEGKIKRWLSGEEEYDFFYTMIWIQMNLGMRIGEVSNMKWIQGDDDYDTGHSRNYIYLNDDLTKLTIYFKRRLRTIPTDSVKDVLEKIPRQQLIRKWKHTRKNVEMIYVFGNAYTNDKRYTNTLSRDFKKILKRCKLSKRYTTHSLRHGWCVNQIRNNSNIYTISKFMGHSMVQVTEIYADHLQSDDFDEIVSNNTPK